MHQCRYHHIISVHYHYYYHDRLSEESFIVMYHITVHLAASELKAFLIGVKNGLILHTGHRQDTWACSYCPDNTGSINYSSLSRQLLLCSVLLTDLALVIQVKLCIFICKHKHVRLLLTMGIVSQLPLQQRKLPAGVLHVTLQTADPAKGKDTKQLIMTGVLVCVCLVHVCQRKAQSSWMGEACTKD